MLVKLYDFGIPGSGKSTIAHYIVDRVNYFNDWSASRISDYQVLHKWFLEDKEQINFHPVDHKGFYVKHPSTYEKALEELKKKMYPSQSDPSKENELIVLEFARSDYVEALAKFEKENLQNSYFLYLDTDIATCIERIERRVKHPKSLDDHYVSPYTLEIYKGKDNRGDVDDLFGTLEKTYGRGLEGKITKIIENKGSLDEALTQVYEFLDVIIEQNSASSTPEMSLMTML